MRSQASLWAAAMRTHRFKVLVDALEDAPPKARDPDPGNAVPWRLRRNNGKYRLGFLLFVGALCLLTLTVPASALVTKEGKIVWPILLGGLVLLALVLLSYYAVAQSDPGYLDSETALRIGEEQALHRDEETANVASESTTRPVRRIIVSSQRQQGSVEGLDTMDEEKDDLSGQAIADVAAAGETDQLVGPPVDVDEDDEEPNEDEDAAISGIPAERLPVRAKFCRKSRRVVATYDHHCVILNTTIGERNRARFWFFMLCSTLGLLWLIAVAHSGIHDAPSTAWLKVNGHALGAAIVLWLTFLGVGGLFFLHTFFMITNMTTYEFLRADRVRYLSQTREFDLPFSSGVLGNIRFFFASDAFCHTLSNRIVGVNTPWRPHSWAYPGPVERNSTDVWNHCWENKYWSCC